MKIVGGSYREAIVEPRRYDLFGSGLKAACAISELDPKLEFVTVISKEDERELGTVAGSFGIKTTYEFRSEPIEFHYITPLAQPRIFGAEQPKVNLDIKADKVLAFGMLEVNLKIEAESVVFDPQRPRDTSFDRTAIKCKSLALVLNQHEAKSLSEKDRAEDAAVEILKKYEADVVVVKCGARGALIVDESGATWVGVRPSKSVWPIGSGDVFSAAFAFSWLEKKSSPQEAARFASIAVSRFVGLPCPAALQQGFEKSEHLIPELQSVPNKVYLAAPFFNLPQLWLVETVRHALLNLGALVFSPLHNVGRGGDEVAIKDLEGLSECGSMIALLDGSDPGTVFEAGFAAARGIPVIGFANNPDASEFKMLRGSGIPIYSDLSTAVYQSIWAGM